MDWTDWFERGAVGRYAACCERDFLERMARERPFRTALQLGMPQWETDGVPCVGRDVMADFAALPFAAESMDLLLVPHGFENGDCEAFAREAWRVLAGDGRLVLCGLNPHSLWRLLYRAEGKLFPNSGRTLPFGRLKAVLEEAGFETAATEWLVCWPLADAPCHAETGLSVLALVYAAVCVKHTVGVRPLDVCGPAGGRPVFAV